MAAGGVKQPDVGRKQEQPKMGTWSCSERDFSKLDIRASLHAFACSLHLSGDYLLTLNG